MRIKIKESKVSESLDKFSSKKDLEDLLVFLKDDTKNSSIKSSCKTNKTLVATKGDSTNPWIFKEWIEDIDKINNWTAKDNRSCTIKIKKASSTLDLNQITDKSDVNGLVGFLGDDTKNANVKSICTENKTVEATKGNNNNEWTFEKTST